MHRACGFPELYLPVPVCYPFITNLISPVRAPVRLGFTVRAAHRVKALASCCFFIATNNIMEEFSYGSEKWKRLRLRILRRDKYQCRICSRYGRIREATDVHHIIHSDERPDLAYDPSNLISLCHSCHEKQHPEKVQKSYKNRLRGNKYERA